MPQSPTIKEQFERLGASHYVAQDLIRKGYTPGLVIALDHPDTQRLFRGQQYPSSVDPLAEHYPVFDPATLERLAKCPWPANDWWADTRTFPGPVNRLCDLAEAGVSPKIAEYLRWDYDPGDYAMISIDQELDKLSYDYGFGVELEDVRFSVTADGVELNAAAEDAWALSLLTGEPTDRAMELLALWEAATRPQWPINLMRFPISSYRDVITYNHLPVDKVIATWRLVMLTRLSEVAPDIPSFDLAFKQEHPNWYG